MADQPIRFDDGAAYERFMGKWSQLAGETFLDWLAPQPGLRWLDVGCGNGASTEMLVERCHQSQYKGIDPSEGQLAFARSRPASRVAQFRQGDAMAQPFPDDTFGVAVMPLVMFFVPNRAKGVAEWCGWSAQAAQSQPTRGTCMEVAFLTRRCRLKCARWALQFRYRQVPARQE